MELEQMVSDLTRQVREQVAPPTFRPGKVSLWLKLVRLVPMDGSLVEENEGPVQKLILRAAAFDDLAQQMAENMVLYIYGAEVPLVREMPNVIMKLFDRKVRLKMAGAPPLEEPGQLFLKATVYEHSPSLWEQLFPRRDQTEES